MGPKSARTKREIEPVNKEVLTAENTILNSKTINLELNSIEFSSSAEIGEITDSSIKAQTTVQFADPLIEYALTKKEKTVAEKKLWNAQMKVKKDAKKKQRQTESSLLSEEQNASSKSGVEEVDQRLNDESTFNKKENKQHEVMEEVTNKFKETAVVKSRRGRSKVEVTVADGAVAKDIVKGEIILEVSTESNSKRFRSKKNESIQITETTELDLKLRTRSKKTFTETQNQSEQDVTNDDKDIQNDSKETKKRTSARKMKSNVEEVEPEGKTPLPIEEQKSKANDEEISSRKKQKRSKKSAKKEEVEESKLIENLSNNLIESVQEPENSPEKTMRDEFEQALEQSESVKLKGSKKAPMITKESSSEISDITDGTNSQEITLETVASKLSNSKNGKTRITSTNQSSDETLNDESVTNFSEITPESRNSPIKSNKNQKNTNKKSSEVKNLEESSTNIESNPQSPVKPVKSKTAPANESLSSETPDVDNAKATPNGKKKKSSIDKTFFDKAKAPVSEPNKVEDTKSPPAGGGNHSTDKIDIDETLEEGFEKVDIYAIFEIPKSATSSEIKRAYHKTALKFHPDKLAGTLKTDQDRAAATKKFQNISIYYAILSDDLKRSRYDATGVIEKEGVVQYENKNEAEWNAYFRELWSGKVSAESISEYEKKYKGSDEQKNEIIAAYNQSQGSMDFILNNVIATTVEDEDFIIGIIETAIANSEIKRLKKFTSSTSPSQRNKRRKDAAKEEMEVRKARNELSNLGDSSSRNDELKAMILQRQQSRQELLIMNLENKYGKASNSKKRKSEETEFNVNETTTRKSKKNGTLSKLTSKIPIPKSRKIKKETTESAKANWIITSDEETPDVKRAFVEPTEEEFKAIQKEITKKKKLETVPIDSRPTKLRKAAKTAAK
ncbi:hypothetical protein HK096_003223 [Nowakowskiella sp. JEL0078]|nr:hypothetical protein HK096_003223 [Nowakowskiella sp. JEL0078]